MSLLSYKIAKFVKEATVRSDMAKRIMYSLIPSVNDNRIDVKALKYAIEGINDLIKYGTMACINELEHYNRDAYYDDNDNLIINNEDKYSIALNLLKLNDYKGALEKSYEAFNEEDHWHKAYGGFAWARIAKSLLNLVNLRSGLKATIENKDYQGELAVMKDIIVEMNIFDGLSHNTASVMRNILEEEDIALRPSFQQYDKNLRDFDNSDLSKLHPNQIKKLKEKFEKNYSDFIEENRNNFHKEKEKTFNMMDAKELSDPIDVYREIEQSLIDSGDINKYQDYISKLRNNPKYRNYDFDKIEKEKKLIKIRKELLPYIKKFNTYNDKINDLNIDNFNDEETGTVKEEKFYYKLSNIINDIVDTGDTLDSKFNRELFKDINKDTDIIKKFNQNRNNLYTLHVNTSNLMWDKDAVTEEDVNEKIKMLYNAKKELKSIVYKFIFILESI